jgi:hypothetical protein
MVCLHFVHSYYCYILHLLIVIYVLLALAQSPPNQHQMLSPLLQISWCTASFPVLLLFSLDLSQLSTSSFVCVGIISWSWAHPSLTQPVVIAAAESGSVGNLAWQVRLSKPSAAAAHSVATDELYESGWLTAMQLGGWWFYWLVVAVRLVARQARNCTIAPSHLLFVPAQSQFLC